MIEQTIQDYFEGFQKAESDLIKKAFHKDVKLLSTSEGKLAVIELQDWLGNLDKRKETGDIRHGELNIVSIDKTGDTASVKLNIKFPKVEFTDYLSMLKLEEKWVIVGKIYHFNSLQNA